MAEVKRTWQVTFKLANGTVISFPILLDAQLTDVEGAEAWGLVAVYNPSPAYVAYRLEARLEGNAPGAQGRTYYANVSAPPYSANATAPLLLSPNDTEYKVGFRLWLPPGEYRLGNYSVVLKDWTLVASNRSILLRPLHNLFVPKVDLPPPCSDAFWSGFDSIADAYDYSLMGDVLLTFVPLKWLIHVTRVDKVVGAFTAVRAAVQGVFGARFLKAASGAVGIALRPEVYIGYGGYQLAQELAKTHEDLAREFGIDLDAVDSFYAGVYNWRTCTEAGKYHAAIYASFITKVSLVADIAQQGISQARRHILDNFYNSLVNYAKRIRAFDFYHDVAPLYLTTASVKGEQLDYVVRDFVKALEPLMSFEDQLKIQRGVGGILVNRYNPMVNVRDRVLRVYYGVVKSGDRFEIRTETWEPVFERGRFLLYYAGEEGGLFVADVLGRDVRRWTNVGAADLLRSGGFLDWSLERREAGGVVCGVLYLAVDDALRGVFSEEAWKYQWRHNLVGMALLQELYDRGYLAQYSMAPRLSKEVINLRYHGEPLPQVVNVKFPSEVGRDDPDALGLMQDGRRVLWLEVSKVEGGTFEDLYRGFRGKLGRLVEVGLFDGRRFTRRGVALVGLAVDAGSGVTVGALLAERYGALEYAAYPRVESQIFRWHRALDRSVGVAPLFVTYQDLGRQLVARFVLLDDVPKGERDLKSAVERCFR